MSTDMLSLEDIRVTYPNGVTALDGIDLQVRQGDFVVLLGPSGAGKSTLLRCMNGLVRPTGGRVTDRELGDVRAPAVQRTHRRRTAMVFQHHHLIGRLSALSNVLTGRLGYHGAWRTLFPLPGADAALALECLDRVGLVDQALARVDQLSGGQQQRVGIARALAQQPTAVLADEPVASLDPAAARHVLGLMREICRADGITAVVSLHQVNYALEFADRVVGIAAGQVVFDGRPDALGQGDLETIYGRHVRPLEAAAEGEAARAAAGPFTKPAAMEVAR